MKAHYWIRSHFHPQGLGETLSAPIQSWMCENCGTCENLPDHAIPSDYIQTVCTGVKPVWKSPIREKAPYEETKDYPAVKKRIKSKGNRR